MGCPPEAEQEIVENVSIFSLSGHGAGRGVQEQGKGVQEQGRGFREGGQAGRTQLDLQPAGPLKTIYSLKSQVGE